MAVLPIKSRLLRSLIPFGSEYTAVKVCVAPVPEVGDSDTTVGVLDVVPVPVNVAVCVEPVTLPELSVTMIVAVLLPAAVGLNVTEIVQFAAAARLLPQVLVWAKSPGFVPPSAMLSMLNGPFPPLVRVRV